MIETRLKGFCGQSCDVVISVSPDRALVRFESERGYGFPSLELEKLESLAVKIKALQELSK